MLQQPPVSDAGQNAAKQSRGYSGYFLWVITFAAAIVIEQLTDSLTLAAIMPCAHAAWRSLRCGFWLIGSDEVRPRAWACFLLYVATACWKAAAAALGTGILCMAVAEYAGQKPPDKLLTALGMILAGGSCLTVLAGIAGLASALRGRARVWVDPALRDACRGDFNRIVDLPRYYVRFNQASIVLIASLLLPVIGLAITIGDAANKENELLSWVGIVILFFGQLAMIPVYAILSSRIIAHTPAECWPPARPHAPDS